MKSKFIFGLLVALLILSVSSCAERVDAGYEGIKVNLYGDDKGVDKVTLVTGMVENFQLEQLTSGLQYPKILIEAINSKNEAVQKSQKAENELAIVKAEAQKKVIAAQAEYEANVLRTKSLTPQILQQMWIEKWNGTVPTVTSNGNSGVFLDISKISK